MERSMIERKGKFLMEKYSRPPISFTFWLLSKMDGRVVLLGFLHIVESQPPETLVPNELSIPAGGIAIAPRFLQCKAMSLQHLITFKLYDAVTAKLLDIAVNVTLTTSSFVAKKGPATKKFDIKDEIKTSAEPMLTRI
jgi:hypothetical protein